MMKPIFIKEFLPTEVLNLAYTYCLFKYSNKQFIQFDEQASSLIGEHSDFLMEAILDMSTPVIEQNVQKKLFPTYSYFRVYDKGSDLKIHTDRPSCEYTVALCLGADPIDLPYDIFLGEYDENSVYKYFLDKTKKLSPHRIDFKFPMVPNDALIFQGGNKAHWREECVHDHYMTVFLHYVDQEGKNKDSKYDNRPMLGFKE